ncbi:hypothetical protein GQ457_08G021450 [Hibiscus cannabinus]
MASHFIGPGGRPPDCTPTVVLSQSHESNNFPALVKVSHVSKKAKDVVTGVENSVSNSPDVTMDDSLLTSELGNQPQQEQTITNGTRLGNVSYTTMASRIPNDKGKMGASSSCSMDDVVILEDDYVIDRSGKIPSIKFSNRIHEHIDNNMRNTVIVRLLGRSIGYKTLHVCLLSLWKLIGDIQLIDLENSYFLVRFEKESDYCMVLTEGPWTIYGCQNRLQYHGRCKGKFARLAVMVDLNKPLLSCINIDGRIQKLEYESLNQICYKCGTYGHAKETCNDTVGEGSSNVNPMPLAGKKTPTRPEPNENDLYMPWMTVDTRRQRSPSTYNNVKSGTARPHYRGDSGSRFSALTATEDEIVEDRRLPEVGNTSGEGNGVKATTDIVFMVVPQQPRAMKFAAYLKSNPTKKPKAATRSVVHLDSDQVRAD